MNEDLIKRAHLKALPVWAWTVDNEEDMFALFSGIASFLATFGFVNRRRLIDMGVDAIYTNWPERLLRILS